MTAKRNLWIGATLFARAYIVAVLLAGLSVLAYGAIHWSSNDLLQLAGYVGVALLVARLRVQVPAKAGRMPVHLPLVLLGLAELSLPETLVIGCLATLMQGISKDKSKTLQVMFEVGVTTLAIAAGYGVCGLPFLHQHGSLPLFLLAGAGIYFLVSALAMTGARALWLFPFEDLPFGIKSLSWSLGYYAAGAGVAAVLVWLNRLAKWQTSLLVLLALYSLYRSYLVYIERLEGERQHAGEVANLHLRTIEALALAIEAKDQTTHDHLQRVRLYAMEVARILKLSEVEKEALQAAALLHDIGKLAVPEHIISKPGRLSPEEFEKMKIHPVVGGEILERVQFPYPVVPIVRAHHEKWDGTGYPHGLKREEIPIGARILSAVDFVDAMASDRQYRRALTLDEVMVRLGEEAGKSFDPKVVAVLEKHYHELEKLVRKRSLEAVPVRLSTDLKIERGAAPAAGFEKAPAQEAGKLQKANFLTSIAAARQEAQTLFEISQDLGASLSLVETLSVFAVKLNRLVPYDAVAIYVCRGQELIPEHVAGDDFRLFSSLRIPVGEGLSGWVAQNRKPIVNGNPSVEPGYLNDPSKFSTQRSALAVPLEGLEGAVGVLTLYRVERDAFTSDHVRILQAVSSKMAMCIENALKYQQAESSATTDYLTELPNARSLFLQLDRELARCKRSNESVTLMVCDMDGFKQINDRFGHLEGNRVLQLFAKRLKETCREYDYVARMGGDEFVVVAPGITPEAAKIKAAQIGDLARQVGREVCGEDILSLSVGQAVFPTDAGDTESVLAEADRRMYLGKQKQNSHKNRRLYSRMRCSVTVEVQLEGRPNLLLGRLSDVSLSGCLVQTSELVATSTRLTVGFSMDDSSLKAEGTVVRSSPGRGIAVRFNDATKEERELLKRIVDYVEGTTNFYDSERAYLSRLIPS